MKAIRIHEYGGPEVLRLEELPTPPPGPGEALVQVEAIGVNFVETYQRRGWYRLPALPSGIGSEAAGVVLETGEGVADARPGDRVAWVFGASSYATHAVVPAEKLVPAPEALSLEQAAAGILQGMTAHALTHRTCRVGAGDRVLVHAAAGGVGRLLCQMAAMLGAHVIGVVSTEEKARIARAAGAKETVITAQQDFLAEVRRITGGAGVNVVYDSVGKDTFDRSLDCLAPLGMLVSFGQSSGFPPPFDIQRLAGMRSLFLTRPNIFAYTASRADLLRHARAVFDWLANGKLILHIDRRYPLADAAQAHADLEGRRTVGKLLLMP